DLARAPAARQVVLGRRRTHHLAVLADARLGPRAVRLAVAVSGEHFEERLALGVVQAGLELHVEARARRRVQAPGETVRDDEHVEAPLRELLEELARRRRVLATARGQRARVDAGLAGRERRDLAHPLDELAVAAGRQRSGD